MTRKFYQRDKSLFEVMEGLLLKNTVLEKGIVVAPVVVVSSSLQNGLILSIAFGIITFFTVLLSSFIPRKIAHTLRVILYTLIAGAIYIPTAMMLDTLFPAQTYRLGIFLPLMVTNSLIIWRSESRFHKETRPRMAVDLLFHILGFAVVICLAGVIKEVLGSGTFFGSPVDWISIKPLGILLPFGGFILLGMMAAVLQKYKNHLTGASKPKDFQENTDIDISLEAFESGYNPLGEIKKQRREGTMHE